jgi:glutamyl-tRNA synthetase
MALFNWAFAKHHGGEFLLRIEDTDLARSTSRSEQIIYDTLRWLGLTWDEGPDAGGDFGPYRQSERREIYQSHIARLLEDGHAFHCFCTIERLDQVRAQQQAAKQTTRYDGHCLDLSTAEVQSRLATGEPHVVRMKVPDTGVCTFVDQLRGEISIPFAQIDMQVLQKADGMPTYHLAVVVDDHLMEISHILRGEEWLNSCPKHQLLYDYFGWTMPQMLHLPLLRNPDQSKLSKRKNPTSVTFYRDEGYLPEALLNYLGLMGWSMPDEREIFSKEEMVAEFDASRISVGGPIFDVEKLRWLNGQYLRRLSPEAFAERVGDWMINRERLMQLVPLLHERVERLSELAPQADYLLGAVRTLKPEDFDHKSLEQDQVICILHHTLRRLEESGSWERDALLECCQALAAAMEIKFRDFLFPLFIAISGRAVALPLFDSLVFLGSDLSRGRLRDALLAFNVSGKQRKRLEKSYSELVLERVD